MLKHVSCYRSQAKRRLRVTGTVILSNKVRAELPCCRGKNDRREQCTTDHAIAVHDWRVRRTKTEWKQRTAESCVLSQQKQDDVIEVEIELDELDLTSADK